MIDCMDCEFCKETPPLGICPGGPYMYTCENPENGMHCGEVIQTKKPRFRGYPIHPLFHCVKEAEHER